jgi:hypothetical protein
LAIADDDVTNSSAWRLFLSTKATATTAAACERNSFYIPFSFHGAEPFPTHYF